MKCSGESLLLRELELMMCPIPTWWSVFFLWSAKTCYVVTALAQGNWGEIVVVEVGDSSVLKGHRQWSGDGNGYVMPPWMASTLSKVNDGIIIIITCCKGIPRRCFGSSLDRRIPDVGSSRLSKKPRKALSLPCSSAPQPWRIEELPNSERNSRRGVWCMWGFDHGATIITASAPGLIPSLRSYSEYLPSYFLYSISWFCYSFYALSFPHCWGSRRYLLDRCLHIAGRYLQSEHQKP